MGIKQKSPIICGSFAKNDPQLKGILWIFATLYAHTSEYMGIGRQRYRYDSPKTKCDSQNKKKEDVILWSTEQQHT